jgi:uncharacterized protein (DUF1499 family)
LKIIYLFLITFICLQAVIRLWPLTNSPWDNNSLSDGSFEVTKLGGYYILQNDIYFDDLKNKILQTPRFRIISDGPLFVGIVRSWFWGFPDMIELWYDDGVHVRGHLMFGLYDLGANKKRILAWLDY